MCRSGWCFSYTFIRMALHTCRILPTPNAFHFHRALGAPLQRYNNNYFVCYMAPMPVSMAQWPMRVSYHYSTGTTRTQLTVLCTAQGRYHGACVNYKVVLFLYPYVAPSTVKPCALLAVFKTWTGPCYFSPLVFTIALGKYYRLSVISFVVRVFCVSLLLFNCRLSSSVFVCMNIVAQAFKRKPPSMFFCDSVLFRVPNIRKGEATCRVCVLPSKLIAQHWNWRNLLLFEPKQMIQRVHKWSDIVSTHDRRHERIAKTTL